MSNPVLYMNVGIPGSGKTTFSNPLLNYDFDLMRQNLNDTNYLNILSTDLVIEEIAAQYDISYNEAFQDLIKFAEKMLKRKLNRAILRRNSCVWDQTNLTKKSRKDKLKMIPNDWKVIGLYFPVSVEDAIARNKKRYMKTIPDKVIEDMAARIEEPSFDEGFEKIYRVTLNDRKYSILQQSRMEAPTI